MKEKLTPDQLWELLSQDKSFTFHSSEGCHYHYGNFYGSKDHIYFSCGEEGCCEDWWTDKETWLHDMEGSTFHRVD